MQVEWDYVSSFISCCIILLSLVCISKCIYICAYYFIEQSCCRLHLWSIRVRIIQKDWEWNGAVSVGAWVYWENYIQFIKIHSKNTRVNVTRKRVHRAWTRFRVKSDLEFGQFSADLTNNVGQIDPALGHFPRQVDRFPGHHWPGIESDPSGPFPGHVWARCFIECKASGHRYPYELPYQRFW